MLGRSAFLLVHISLILFTYFGITQANITQQTSYSILVSGIFIGVYFAVFIWSFKNLLKKNSMGLVVFTLSTKFIVLIAFVMYCMTNKSFNAIGLIIGLSTVIPSVVIWSLLNKKGVNFGTF